LTHKCAGISRAAGRFAYRRADLGRAGPDS
jgi:hypothetical protein